MCTRSSGHSRTGHDSALPVDVMLVHPRQRLLRHEVAKHQRQQRGRAATPSERVRQPYCCCFARPARRCVPRDAGGGVRTPETRPDARHIAQALGKHHAVFERHRGALAGRGRRCVRGVADDDRSAPCATWARRADRACCRRRAEACRRGISSAAGPRSSAKCSISHCFHCSAVVESRSARLDGWRGTLANHTVPPAASGA